MTIDVLLSCDVDMPVTYNDNSTDLSTQTDNDEECPSPDFKEVKGRRMKRKMRNRGSFVLLEKTCCSLKILMLCIYVIWQLLDNE